MICAPGNVISMRGIEGWELVAAKFVTGRMNKLFAKMGGELAKISRLIGDD